jgi:tetratricopeptide (TPR) repeat protein
LSKAALLYGDDVLLNEYNERVREKLSAESSKTGENWAKTVGVIRGMQQMELDIQMYDPFNTYMGINSAAGAYFDAKNQFYRLISLLLSDLGMIFNIKCPSPWQIISELFTREIISKSQSVDMRKCLSFANEIRLKTYFANNGQKELISPLSQYANPTQQSVDAAVFQDVDQNVLVNFLNTSYHLHRQCKQFSTNGSIFCEKPASFSNAFLLGIHYYRLQNFREALNWVKSVSKDNPYYVHCLVAQGHIYFESGEYDKSIKCFEEALEMDYQNESSADVPKLYNGLANALLKVGEHEMAIDRTEEAINKHNEIFGKKSQDSSLIILWVDLGNIYHSLQRFDLALQAFNKAQEIEKELTSVPDMFVACIYINLAVTLSELDQQEKSIKCIEKGLQLSQKVLGKDNLSIFLAEHYTIAGRVYHRCKQEDDAVRFFERSLELYECIVGNYPHPGKYTT